MAQKKVSRKELLKEPDEILTVSRRIFAFALTHRVQLLSALGAICAITLVISGVQFFAERREAEAFRLLKDGREEYRTVAGESSPAEAYAAVRDHFESLISAHGNRDGGKLARLAFADMAYEAGDHEAAVNLYAQALEDFGDDPALRNLVLSGLAYAHEGQGDSEAAVRHFERIASGTGAALKSDALFQLGRLYAEMGRSEKSRETYERLLEHDPDFLYADLVKERLGRRS
jgi:tetratricopeptide (TPR) repeat protein